MIQQVVKMKITPMMGLLLIVCITLGTILLSMGSFYLRQEFNIYYTEYAIYILLVGVCFFTIRRAMTEYRYCLYDDEVVINRLQGRRQRILLILHLWEITSITDRKPSRAEVLDQATVVQVLALRQKRWYIEYEQCGKRGLLICSPGDTFIEQIRKAIAARQGQGPLNGQSVGDRTIMHQGMTPC